MTRAVIYTRVSSDPTKGGRSVAEQEKECRTVCEKNGWPVAAVLSDNDIGASRHSKGDRLAYAQLSHVLEPGDILVMWESSRAQRNLGDFVGLRDLCAERGVRWCISGSILDPAKGGDRFTAGLYALIDEKAAEETRDRVKRAQRSNAQKGMAHGRIVYGYRAIRDPNTGRIVERVPDEERAPIVREIARRMLAGEANYAIAQDLNARGVPPKVASTKGWTTSSISQLMKSSTLAGIRTHLNEQIPGVWEPIISIEQHKALISMLSDPARISHRGTEPIHLLSGIASCGVCRAKVRRTKNGPYLNYSCTGQFCVVRRQPLVDKMVSEAVIGWCEKATGLDQLAEPEQSDALAEARALRLRLDEAADLYAAGDLSPSMLARIEGKLLPQIRQLERDAQVHVAPELVSMLGTNARSIWAAKVMPEKRIIVRSLMTVTINKTRRSNTFNPDSIQIDWIH